MDEDLTQSVYALLLYAIGEGVRSLDHRATPIDAAGLLGIIESAMKECAGKEDLPVRNRLLAGYLFQQWKAYILFGETYQVS